MKTHMQDFNNNEAQMKPLCQKMFKNRFPKVFFTQKKKDVDCKKCLKKVGSK